MVSGRVVATGRYSSESVTKYLKKYRNPASSLYSTCNQSKLLQVHGSDDVNGCVKNTTLMEWSHYAKWGVAWRGVRKEVALSIIYAWHEQVQHQEQQVRVH